MRSSILRLYLQRARDSLRAYGSLQLWTSVKFELVIRVKSLLQSLSFNFSGNYPNQFPYIYGLQCSLCPGSCRNGLCPSTCASNSWLPQAPAPPPQAQAPAPAQIARIVTTIPPPAAATQPQSPAVTVPLLKPVISKPAPISKPVEQSRPVIPPNKSSSIDQPKSIDLTSNKQEKIRTEIISNSKFP